MEQFEYMYLDPDDNTDRYEPKFSESILNEHGREGWELVGFNNGIAWFKRKLNSTITIDPRQGCCDPGFYKEI